MVETEALLTTRILSDTASTNYWILTRQTAGLTHADSLLQLPFRGNCLNWVIGHILSRRNEMLELVGAETVGTEVQRARYNTGSEPITRHEDALSFEQILADLATAQERLIAGLELMTPDDLNAPVTTIQKDPPPTVEERLRGLLWHETYHVGQTEILRQLAGTNDKVI
ncbi:MAG: DinB family protein [Chloroflexota bacterium]